MVCVLPFGSKFNDTDEFNTYGAAFCVVYNAGVVYNTGVTGK